jgi:hypothetical protein
MHRSLALRPDLCDCVLEDRTMPAGYVWTPMPFLPINNMSNALVVSGFSVSGGMGSSTVNSGANAYFLMMGINTNIYGLVGQINVIVPPGYALGLSMWMPPGAGSLGGLSITVGSGADDASAGSIGSSHRGYGASFNAGYGTALTSLNGYGMSVSPVGAATASTSSSSSDTTSETGNTPSQANGGSSPQDAPNVGPGQFQGPAGGFGAAMPAPGAFPNPMPSPFGNGPGVGPAVR